MGLIPMLGVLQAASYFLQHCLPLSRHRGQLNSVIAGVLSHFDVIENTGICASSNALSSSKMSKNVSVTFKIQICKIRRDVQSV